MELIIWNKGVQGVKYLCDKCSKNVSESEGLWVVGSENKSVCFACMKDYRRKK